MGLFTNRKREVDDDVVKSSEAIDDLEPSWIDDPPEPVTGEIPDLAAPFADAEADARSELAHYGIDLAETEPAVPPAPQRSLTEEPSSTAQAGNVEVDAHGLLEMLGLTVEASLIDISQARLRFLAEHDPMTESDPEAAQLKEQIRRQVNTAYASFRLTRAH